MYQSYIEYQVITWCQKWDIMTSYQISAIEAFDSSTPTEWPNWSRCLGNLEMLLELLRNQKKVR